jgi:hypothetical protein
MVPKEVWTGLALDPNIQKLEQQRTTLRQGNYQIEGHHDEKKIRKLTNEIRLKRAQRQKEVVKAYREHYFYHRPTWDIEMQARGEEEEEYVEPVIDVVIPTRARLAEILCHQPDDLNEDQILQCRIEAIDLMVALCDKRETVKRDRVQLRVSPERPIKAESPGVDGEVAPSPDPFPLLMQATQCPDCIGDERLSINERTFPYCRPAVMNDHFDDHHLARREQAEKQRQAIKCEHPKCRDIDFQHLDHFRSHVQEQHGIALRTSNQVEQRRLRKARRRRMVKAY